MHFSFEELHKGVSHFLTKTEIPVPLTPWSYQFSGGGIMMASIGRGKKKVLSGRELATSWTLGT